MLLTDENTLLPGENTLLLSEDMVLFCGDPSNDQKDCAVR